MPTTLKREWHGVGQYILKGVYYALVLTVRNLVNFKRMSKKQSNVNAPWVCYIHISLCLRAIGVLVCQWQHRASVVCYMHQRGLSLLVSDIRAYQSL